MPTYVYKFLDSGETIEVQQSFTDESLTEFLHPESGSLLPVKKVFQPVGVTFKGSGFFKTDNRGAKATSSDGAGSGSSDSKSSDKSSDSKSSDSKSSDSKSSDSKSSDSKSSDSKSSDSKSSDSKSTSSPSKGAKTASSTSVAASRNSD